VEGCQHCKAGTLRHVRFGPNRVTCCSDCHALSIAPVLDARMPRFEEHVKALRDEIAAEEEDARSRRVDCIVEAAEPTPAGARLRLQAMRGELRGLARGVRVEGFLDGRTAEDESANLDILRRAGPVIEAEADDRDWAHLRQGASVSLVAESNATIHRNLLKAFLAVKRNFSSIADLERPGDMPRLALRPAPLPNETGLRPSQTKALRAAASLPERGILLIQGPPGTGKTTVIARLIANEVARRRTVLLVSHTHVAIDNALRKAIQATPALAKSVVRLGDAGRVSADLADLNRRVSSFRMDPTDPKAKPLFANLQDRHPVVAMTLDALGNAILYADQDDQEVRPFDTVIVDEAGMNGFPKTAIAHAVAKRLVLVGDPLQLPPIVRSRSFGNDANHRRSHFETLQMLRPDLAVLLDEQFRSQAAIYEWSRDAVYGGRVTSQTKPQSAPVRKIRGHALTSPVVWFDTAAIKANRSESVGSSRANPTHVAVAMAIALDLVKAGVAPDAMGYITPFRAQAAAWADAVANGKSKTAALARMTASTVDAFQGNERRVILFDLTTTHPAKPHEDHRRLNVSLTRAQELLAIIGPRPFVKKPEENPYLWSLQNWKAPQVVQAAAP
jgi:hypothetical protein